jgi:hypothetical protein
VSRVGHLNTRQTGSTSTTSKSSDHPTKEAADGKGLASQHEYRYIGTQHRNRKRNTKPAMGPMFAEEGCMQTVRCTSMEPASTNNPITTHTPSRLLDSTPPNEPHPTMPKACKHMEASCGAMSNYARHDKLQPTSECISRNGPVRRPQEASPNPRTPFGDAPTLCLGHREEARKNRFVTETMPQHDQ